MSWLKLLWLMGVLVSAGEGSEDPYVLTAESAEQIVKALDQAATETGLENVLEVHDTSLEPRQVVLRLTLRSHPRIVVLRRPHDEADAASWRNFRPDTPSSGTDDDLETLMKAFDQAFKESPWGRITDDRRDIFPSVPAAPPAPSSTASPALVFLLGAYASHWLLFLVLIAVWLRKPQPI